MPVQTKKSVLSQYGPSGDLAAQIAADTSLPSQGFQDPPPGIKQGVAQLEEVKFDVFKSGDNEGKPYFTASGLILEPHTVTYTPTSGGQPVGEPTTVEVSGMMTRIQPIGIHDVKIKSGKNMGQTTPWQKQAMAAAAHLRALGIDTSKVKQLSDLEVLADQLTQVARNPQTPIYFRFSTSVRKATNAGDMDGVWQNWHGTAGLENYVPPDYSQGEAALLNGKPRSTVAPEVNDESGDVSDGAIGEGEEEFDLDACLEAAKGGDSDAQEELLRRAAEKTGQTTEEINDSAESWDAVAAMIAEGVKDNTEEAPAPPAKGNHYNYFPMVKGPRGAMTKAKKAVECVVTTANAEAGTVTLKSTVDNKTLYKDVPWAELIEM